MLIDASGEPDTVAASIWAALRDRFFATARQPARHERPQESNAEIGVSASARNDRSVRPSRGRGGACSTPIASGRIPHAWLIGGAQGIGKATLAYRMARFVLAHRDPLAPSVQRADTLAVDPRTPWRGRWRPGRMAAC